MFDGVGYEQKEQTAKLGWYQFVISWLAKKRWMVSGKEIGLLKRM